MQYHTVHYVEHPGEVIVPSVERGGGEDLVIHSTVVTGDASDVLRGVPDKKNPVRAMTTRPPTPKGMKPKEPVRPRLVGLPSEVL